MQKDRSLIAWISTLLLSAVEGLAAILFLARLPADSEGRSLFGYSIARLGLMLIMLLLASGFFGAAVGLWRSKTWQKKWIKWGQHPNLPAIVLLAGLGVMITCLLSASFLLDLYRTGGDFRFFAYYERLAPLLFWLSLVGFQLFLVNLLINGRNLGDSLSIYRKTILIGLLVWVLFLGFGVLVRLTGIGITYETTGSFGLPAVPLLEWQIWLSVFLAGLFLLLRFQPETEMTRSHGINKLLRPDVLISLVIFIAAGSIWLSQPLIPAYFATPGRAPNFEVYPFSDGATYDQYAQSLLIGNGFMGGEIPQRPLYIVFLAALHLLAGRNYLSVIFLQSWVLAVFPVVLYWIGKEIHSRPAGFLAAMLVILRETTTIHSAPFTDNISYTKLYFSEIPTAVCLSLFTLFAIRWLKMPSRRLAPLAAGGFLGLAMLIRTQSGAVLPLALLISLLVFRKDWKQWAKGAALLLAGLILCVTPWLLRNGQITGRIVFDNPESQTMVLAQRYNNIPFDEIIPRLPAENDGQYSGRLVQMAVSGILSHPGESAKTIANHFLNNEICNLLIFPIRSGISSLNELKWPSSPFWQNWNGSLTAPQGLLLAANLFLIALSLAAAFRQTTWVALLPLAVNLSYNFGTAIFRSSGERFLLPVDWVSITFYAVGLVEVLVYGMTLLHRPVQLTQKDPASKRKLKIKKAHQQKLTKIGSIGISTAALGICFLLAGSTLPLAERIFPKRYPLESGQQILSALLAEKSLQSAGVDQTAIQNLTQQPGAILYRGRALYPRYYEAGESEPKTAKVGYSGMNVGRTVFFFLSEANGLVVLPGDSSPTNFPDSSDVILLGCQRKAYIEAILVAVTGENSTAILSSALIPKNCSQ